MRTEILWLDIVSLLFSRKQSSLLRDLELMARYTRIDNRDFQFRVADYCVSWSRIM